MTKQFCSIKCTLFKWVSTFEFLRWVMLEAGGGYLGSTLGAFAYDVFGFQWATVVESGVSLLFVRVQ